MGVIIRQSIKTTIVTLVGVAIGLFNLLFIYKLDFAAYGFLQIILSASMLLSPIASLGARGIINRYYYHFRKTPEGRATFFTAGLLILFVGSGLMAILGWVLFLPTARRWAGPDNNFALFIEYGTIIYFLMIGQVLLEYLDGYIQNFKLVTVQTIFTGIVPKLVTGVLVYGAYFYEWSYGFIGYGLLVMNAIIILCLLLYLHTLGELRLSFNFRPYFSREICSSMLSYAAYGIVGVIGSKIALQIDTISLGSFVSEKAVGIYRVVVFAAIFVDIPLRSMSRITIPVVAEHIANGNFTEVEKLYKDSSRTLTYIGVFLCTLIVVSLQDLFLFLGEEEEFVGGVLAFVYLGGARVVNMITSINNQIVMYSQLYRYNLIFVIGLALMNIYFNKLMIVDWEMGITGAALATFLSSSLYNIIRSGLVYGKLKLHPLSWPLGIPLLLCALCTCLFASLAMPFSAVINILVKSVFVGLSFLAVCYYTPFFPAIKQLINTGLERRLRF